MMIMNRIHPIIIFSIIVLLSLVSCDDREPDSGNLIDSSICFKTSLYGNMTRGPGVSYITRDDYDGLFYIDRFTEDTHKRSPYVIHQKRNGVLSSFGVTDSLRWFSKNGAHTFYCWTLPWHEVDQNNIYSDSEWNNSQLEVQTEISFEENAEMYGNNPENYRFCLEKFIGGKTGPLTYNVYGEYIDLRLQHLVSKIIITSVELDKKKVDGYITFEGLPSEGTFNRYGTDRPEVTGNEESESTTYSFIGNATNTLYVCPDIDFHNVKFRIKVNSGVTEQGEFLGDFSTLQFNRDMEDWWDYAHQNPSILYAGEVMNISITLRQGFGTQVSLSIGGWSNQPAREANDYPYQGIYHPSDLNELTQKFPGGGDGKYAGKEDIEESLFEKFGNKETGEYDLFTDIDDISQRLAIGKRHVLNGNGYTLTFSKNYNNTQYVRISKMRDVYLVDPDGHTIYIDNNFDVWIVGADGNKVKTTYHLDDLDENNENENCYEINLTTGEVKKGSRY